jgi:hypothetical protein
VGPLGDQDPALGVQDVAGQFGAAAGGVDTGDGRAREGRRAQPQGIFRGVVEQHADVGLGAGRQQVREECRPGRGAGATSWWVSIRCPHHSPGRWSPHRSLHEFRDGTPLDSMGAHGS